MLAFLSICLKNSMSRVRSQGRDVAKAAQLCGAGLRSQGDWSWPGSDSGCVFLGLRMGLSNLREQPVGLLTVCSACYCTVQAGSEC